MESALEKLSTTKAVNNQERQKRVYKPSKPRSKLTDESKMKSMGKRIATRIFILEAFDRWMKIKKASAFSAVNDGQFANHLLDIHDTFCKNCQGKTNNNTSVTKIESDNVKIETDNESSDDDFTPIVSNPMDEETSSSTNSYTYIGLPVECEIDETKENAANQSDQSLEPVMVFTNPETGTIETIPHEKKNSRKPLRPNKVRKKDTDIQSEDKVSDMRTLPQKLCNNISKDNSNGNFENNFKNHHERKVISVSEKFIHVLQEEKSRSKKGNKNSGTLISKKSHKTPKLKDNPPDGPPRMRGRPRKNQSLEEKYNHQWMCPKCGKICNNKTNVKRHMQVMHLDKKYACLHEDCNKKYATAYDLKLHEKRIHLNIKPAKLLPCPYDGCLLRFSSASRIKKHLIKHTGERPFLCTQCGKGFKRADNLKVHERQHTDEKPVQCKLCTFTCRQKASLNHHMIKHHSPANPSLKQSPQHINTSSQLSIPPLPPTSSMPHPPSTHSAPVTHHPPHAPARLLLQLESENSLMPLDSSDFILTIL